MNDRDDQIKDLLDSAAPDQPDLPAAARTTAVRDRAGAVRRRNRLVLAAAVVAVVGVGVGVPVLTSGGGDPDRTSEVADDPRPPEVQAPPACPAEPIDVSQGLKVDALPDGAISARACTAGRDGAAGDSGAEGQTLPPEPLVGEAAEAFVGSVDALPAYTLEDECALIMVTPVPWAIVVSYPDGTSQTLGSTSQVCATVPVAGTDRSADAIVGLFYDAAGVERVDKSGSLGIGPSAEIPACPTDQTGIDEILADSNTYSGDVADFEADFALVCYVPGSEQEPAYTESEAMVRPGDEATFGDDLTATFTTTPQRAGRCDEDGPRRVLYLNDAANATITLVENSCTGEFSGHGVFWLPGEQAAGLLDEALTEDYFFS